MSRPHARSIPAASRRESTRQIVPSARSLDPPHPAATLPRPTSPGRHQTPLPQGGLLPFQIQCIPRYILSASGRSSNHQKVVVAQLLSLIRRPDAPIKCEKSGLAHIPEKWVPVFRKGYAPTQE